MHAYVRGIDEIPRTLGMTGEVNGAPGPSRGLPPKTLHLT